MGFQFNPSFIPAVFFPLTSADPHSNLMTAFLIISVGLHHSTEQPHTVPFSRLFVAPEYSLSSSCLLPFCSLFSHFNTTHQNKNRIQQVSTPIPELFPEKIFRDTRETSVTSVIDHYQGIYGVFFIMKVFKIIKIILFSV